MSSHRSDTAARVSALSAVLDAATEFGLTREEVSQAFQRTLQAVQPDSTEEECLDEVAGLLAREILGKQRRLLRARYG
jgi:hypothetical protein